MKKSLAKKPNPGPARPAPGRAPVGGQAKVKERIDVALVSRGLAPTREKAARLLLAGAVLVDGRRVDKPGVLVAPGAELKVTARQKFVSRGGDKLAHALVAFGVEPKGRVCVDVGASTGGFTHCLLENGAARVYAVDVGQGQLDASLRADGRVVVMEKTNARQLAPDAFPDPPTLATIDISFTRAGWCVMRAITRPSSRGWRATACSTGGTRAQSRCRPSKDQRAIASSSST